MPFWACIGLLSLTQGAIVALPRAGVPALVGRLRSPLWALVPAASVVLFVALANIADRDSAHALTYLALVAVPVLAVMGLGWLMHGATPPAALLVAPLFALAWADSGGLAGEAGAVALSGLSCVALGVLLAATTPARWLRWGIIAMAVTDTALVVADLLQRPNSVLNAAHPAAGLPKLQAAIFGSAAMGYGDLFIAGVLGGLLAVEHDRVRQLIGAGLVALLALAFDLLFFVVNELPATVPVAAALVLLAARPALARPSRPPAERSAAMGSPR